MGRGPKKHIKRVAAPKAWLLDKMGGVYATRPTQGPHKLRECVPLTIILKETLKYALTGQEAKIILKDQGNQVLIDNKVRRYFKYPVGLMDVVYIPKTGDQLRVLYDVKGRFTFVPIKDKERNFKLCKIMKKFNGPNRIPYLITHDSRTIRFATPGINVGDTVKLNIETGEILETYRRKVGNLCIVTSGNNKGRVGVLHNIVQKPGQIHIVSVVDSNGKTFSTRLSNTFIIGDGKVPAITLPKGLGLKQSILERAEAVIDQDEDIDSEY